MPIYEYQCPKCLSVEEVILSGKPTECFVKCEKCGGAMEKIEISLSAFHLKGKGWYATDYTNKGKKKEKENK